MPMKQIFAILIVIACILLLCGCGDSDSGDVEKKDNPSAVVRLPDDTLAVGKVDGYLLLSDGFVQVTIHGTTYMTSPVNVCIIK